MTMDFLDCLVYGGYSGYKVPVTRALWALLVLGLRVIRLVCAVNSGNWGENLTVTSSRVEDLLSPVVEPGCKASLFSFSCEAGFA